MVRRRLSLRNKPIDWSEARTPLCCAPWQPRTRRTANSRTRLELPSSAMQLARMHGEDSLTTDLDQQIALYQLGMPYRETVK